MVEWVKGARLGSGGFASVYKAKEIGGKKRDMALKVFMTKEQLGPDCAMSKAELDARIRREVKIFGSLDHENIAWCIQAKEVDKKIELLMAFYKTDLFDVIEKQKRSPYRKDVPDFYHRVINQMLSALAYLASKKLIHCDFKPENILCNDAYHFYLSDFGAAHYEGDYESCGPTYQFRSPEAWAGRFEHRGDVWSLGIVGLEILDKAPVWSDKAYKHNPQPYIDEVARVKRGAGIPKEIYEMLEHDVKYRKSARSITRAVPPAEHHRKEASSSSSRPRMQTQGRRMTQRRKTGNYPLPQGTGKYRLPSPRYPEDDYPGPASQPYQSQPAKPRPPVPQGTGRHRLPSPRYAEDDYPSQSYQYQSGGSQQHIIPQGIGKYKLPPPSRYPEDDYPAPAPQSYQAHDVTPIYEIRVPRSRQKTGMDGGKPRRR